MRVQSVIVLAAISCLTALLLSACSTTYMSQYSAPLEVKLQADVVPEVIAGDPIEGQADISRFICFKWGADEFADGVDFGAGPGGDVGLGVFSSMIPAGKAAAAYDACIRNKADIIIAPRYKIFVDDYWIYEKQKFYVKGYKGTFKGLKKDKAKE